MTQQELDVKVDEIRDLHRSYKSFQNGRLRLNNQQLAMVRRVTECKEEEAPKILKTVLEGGLIVDENLAPSAALAPLVLPFEPGKEPLRKQEVKFKRLLGKSATQLPVYSWVEPIVGFGAVGLGQIVGECGNLDIYENPAKLWTRMGVGLHDGERQRKVKGDPLKAVEMKYSPKRRAILWNIGTSLIKLNDGEYRALYNDRKVYETPRVETKMHAHAVESVEGLAPIRSSYPSEGCASLGAACQSLLP